MINPYALDFPMCTDTDVSLGSPSVSSTSRKLGTRYAAASSQSHQLYNLRNNIPPFLPKDDIYHPCAERNLSKYLNREDVKKALHVNTNRTWRTCTDEISYSKDDIMTSQIHLYKELINRAKVNGTNLSAARQFYRQN